MKKIFILGLSLLSFFSEAQTRNMIDIPAYSGLTGITRKAQVVAGFNKDEFHNYILSVHVYHYKSGVPQVYLDKTVYLVATNDEYINPSNFSICTDTTGCVQEYWFLNQLVNVSKIYTINELEDMFIPLRITQINKDLYGN